MLIWIRNRNLRVVILVILKITRYQISVVNLLDSPSKSMYIGFIFYDELEAKKKV